MGCASGSVLACYVGYPAGRDPFTSSAAVGGLPPETSVVVTTLSDGSSSWQRPVSSLIFFTDAPPLHKYRQTLAHESGSLILDPDFEVDDELIQHARDVLDKIARFWARIGIDTDPAFDGRDIAEDDIQIPVVSFFDHIHTIERAWQQQLRERGSESPT